MLWVVPVFPVLRRKRQEFEASLGCGVRLSMERERNRPFSEPVSPRGRRLVHGATETFSQSRTPPTPQLPQGVVADAEVTHQATGPGLEEDMHTPLLSSM